MNAHLDDLELAAAVAGLDLEPSVAEHLAVCATCRDRVAAMESLLERRRLARRADEPDWEAQRRAVLAGLPTPRRLPIPRVGLWWRPLLAAAAVLALATTVALVRSRETAPPARPDLPVEQILADVDATLDRGGIPGFGPLGSLVPGVEGTEELDDLLVNGAS
jgi:AcrR family transcriptional regulator